MYFKKLFRAYAVFEIVSHCAEVPKICCTKFLTFRFSHQFRKTVNSQGRNRCMPSQANRANRANRAKHFQQWGRHQCMYSGFWCFSNSKQLLFTFEYIQKLSKIKEYRLESKWFGGKKSLAGGFFTNLQRAAHFCTLLRNQTSNRVLRGPVWNYWHPLGVLDTGRNKTFCSWQSEEGRLNW